MRRRTPRTSLGWLLVVLLGALTPAAASAQVDIVGDWHGSLEVPGATLPLIFHITETDGSLSATLDSPAQGATGIPVDTVTFEDGHVTLHVNAIGGGYEGDLSNDTLRGSWSQSGMSFDLTLERGEEGGVVMHRPQEPHAPFPYDIEEVRIASSAAGEPCFSSTTGYSISTTSQTRYGDWFQRRGWKSRTEG